MFLLLLLSIVMTLCCHKKPSLASLLSAHHNAEKKFLPFRRKKILTVTIMANTASRIPLALQKIFMASNQGEEVHDAPQEASRVYRRSRDGQPKPVMVKYNNPALKRTYASVSLCDEITLCS